MILDYLDSMVELTATLAALSICLFHYISHKSKELVYVIALFLCGFMSGYYWTVYLLVVGNTPNVSNLFYYFGWNVGYLILLLLILRIKSREERRYFHPLMLLPIPLNIWQLTLYLPFGGSLNSVYQVSILTAVAVFSIQSILWQFKQKERDTGKLRLAVAILLFTVFSFAMWTFSCYDYPVYYLYYPAAVLLSLNYFFIVYAAIRAFTPAASLRRDKREAAETTTLRQDLKGASEEDISLGAKYARILKSIYLIALVVCSTGGLILGRWIRNTLETGLVPAEGSNIYDIIMVVLFIISLFLTAFVVVIIFMVNLMEKSIENQQLREARLVADRANEAKSEFLANMSHEIRTPINAIMGMNEIILRESTQAGNDTPSDPKEASGIFQEITGYAGNVERAGKNLLAIINDILDFSKIEAGKLELANAEYRFGAVLNDVTNMIAFPAKSKGLVFRVSVAKAIPDGLYGDAVRLRQIMTNLLNNAVKYTETGSVKLSVSCEPKTGFEKGGTVRLVIAVSDTGVGIREEELNNLFNKFERADLEHNSTIEGTGLGLAITKELLDLMGGTIKVESVYGEGSTFTAVIPQQIVSTEPVGNYREEIEQNARPTNGQGALVVAPGAKILLVDDTTVNLTVVSGLLKKSGMQIDTAKSGKEAVRMAADKPYDMILMDQRMPEMDGTQALHLIREQAGGANTGTPVICLTADAVGGAREKYIAEGFTDYLTKPVDGRSLREILVKYLPKNRIQ
ncbi:MAG: response regulator [Lachnospiraceae bacterium]|nr:response regulator [Lachnospiraceae bacterium]